MSPRLVTDRTRTGIPVPRPGGPRSQRRATGTGWIVTIVVDAHQSIDRRTGKALATALRDVAGSVHGHTAVPDTHAPAFQAMLVLDDTERHVLDATKTALDRFRQAARELGLPEWPVTEIRVTRP